MVLLVVSSTVRYKEVKSKATSYLDARLYSQGEQWGHNNNRHHNNNGHHVTVRQTALLGLS
jgi:hypothetical protein